MKRRVRNVLIGVAGVVAAAFITLNVIDTYHHPERVAYMLNISAPPASLHVFDCESGPPTDIVITCAIEIDPREFPLLVAGYQFAQTPMDGTSYSVGLPKLGPEFPVAVEYSVQPSSFEHGGFVRVFSDKERRRALVDLYIE
jgi:hypothetical protein